MTLTAASGIACFSALRDRPPTRTDFAAGRMCPSIATLRQNRGARNDRDATARRALDAREGEGARSDSQGHDVASVRRSHRGKGAQEPRCKRAALR